MSEEKKFAPISVSWSMIRMAEECRAKAYLYRTGKKSPAADIRMYFHGTVVDRVMRTWLSLDNPQPGEMAEMVRDVVDQEELAAINSGDGVVRWKNKGDRDEMTLWCIELVTRLEPILYEHVLPYEYEPAKRFKVPAQISWLDGSPTAIQLAGEMDLLVRDDRGRFTVWDLKGTADNSYWRKTLGQLTFYDIAVQEMFGQGPCLKTGLIQPMCKERVLEFKFTEDDYRQMWTRINRYVSDIWLKDYEPKKDSVGCSWCGVRHACPKYAIPTLNPGGRRVLNLQAIKKVNEIELGMPDVLSGE